MSFIIIRFVEGQTNIDTRATFYGRVEVIPDPKQPTPNTEFASETITKAGEISANESNILQI